MEILNVYLKAVLVLQLSGGESTSCPNTSATVDTKPLYLLTLASIPDDLAALSGTRIARDEINNHTDLLPGYHIELIVGNTEECSSSEAGIGLSNLVKYTVSPPCRPVVAVNGLGCSLQTSVLSPVAGHDGYDLIQLSSANSPIFQTQNHRFPHLWQFLGSATVYSDTILAIMDQYNWNRIGVVFDVESMLFSGIARYLTQALTAANKTTEFIIGIRKTKDSFLNAAISNIRTQQTTILVSLLNLEQEAALLHQAFDENLVYPDYTWIHVERLPQHLNATRGHIYLHTQTHLKPDTVLVSGETFADFGLKHSKDIKLIEQQYNYYNLTPSVFASYWYDQVWAIALAVNNSLPVLENRKISIDNYTIGQREITGVIEEQMANLSFQGAGGWVEFNQYHSVSTPVEVHWVSGNGTERLVGLYNPMKPRNFHVAVPSSDLPDDSIPSQMIPIGVAILLYILTGVVTMFTTVQLILYLRYRHHKLIKATSPHLSLLMFAGCYLFCIAAVLNITDMNFSTIPALPLEASAVNATSLMLITLFIKLLRVYRIFRSSSHLKSGAHLGRCLRNSSLLVLILVLSVIPNIMVITRNIFSSNNINIIPIRSLSYTIKIVINVYFAAFLLLICFLAILTRKIKYKDFKDTKTTSLFIAIIVLTFTVSLPLNVSLTAFGKQTIAEVVETVIYLIYAVACQSVLFMPKIIPVVFTCTRLIKNSNNH